ncbi:hypothetical protein PUN4_560048 [Paraburkholderia unamae]|nr:hypothetical protein PUN4_560048 [Paraburkholderia unamae]
MIRVTPELILMTLAPSPRCFTAACVTSSGPSTLVSNCRWNSSVVMSSTAENAYTPELFTTISRRPNESMAVCTSFAASAGCETSPPTAVALPPASWICSTTASAPALLLAYVTTTAAPSFASARAIAAPIPFDAPVTSATLPSSLAMTNLQYGLNRPLAASVLNDNVEGTRGAKKSLPPNGVATFAEQCARHAEGARERVSAWQCANALGLRNPSIIATSANGRGADENLDYLEVVHGLIRYPPISSRFATRSMQWIEKRRVRVAGVKNNDTERIVGAAVIAGHLHVRRLHHCLTLSNGDGCSAFHLQRERPLKHIHRHRKPVSMKNGFIAGFETRCQNANLLLFASRHTLYHLLKKHLRLDGSRLLRRTR